MKIRGSVRVLPKVHATVVSSRVPANRGRQLLRYIHITLQAVLEVFCLHMPNQNSQRIQHKTRQGISRIVHLPDGASLDRASRAGAALGMPVAAAVVSARVLAELEGFMGCHPERPRLTDPSATLAAIAPYRAPMTTCA